MKVQIWAENTLQAGKLVTDRDREAGMLKYDYIEFDGTPVELIKISQNYRLQGSGVQGLFMLRVARVLREVAEDALLDDLPKALSAAITVEEQALARRMRSPADGGEKKAP